MSGTVAERDTNTCKARYDGKHVLELIHHWTEAGAGAHAAACFPAFLLEARLERWLKGLGVGASFREEGVKAALWR